uniref:DUF1907 domain-containing protein n=1 Tax=Echinostoma caproni TaxID=27848 RepID=A0A183B0J5_9TREM
LAKPDLVRVEYGRVRCFLTDSHFCSSLFSQNQQWKLRLEHFHCFNRDRTKAGHCHFDTDGTAASYRAYLVPGRKLLRVDKPQ